MVEPFLLRVMLWVNLRNSITERFILLHTYVLNDLKWSYLPFFKVNLIDFKFKFDLKSCGDMIFFLSMS